MTHPHYLHIALPVTGQPDFEFYVGPFDGQPQAHDFGMEHFPETSGVCVKLSSGLRIYSPSTLLNYWESRLTGATELHTYLNNYLQ